jgi:ATP-dependent RNA helicase DeaD
MDTPKTFDDLKLSPELMKAIKEIGYGELFPIQAQTIPKLLAGEDIIGQAQTGTGKTAAFVIPILERMNPDVRDVQAIILEPTRELAVQINDEFKKLGKYKRGRSLAIYGGVSIDRQVEILHKGVQIVVGTPGRVIDLIKRGHLNLGRVTMLVLDEADRMLDMGFIDDIRFILENTPHDKQMMLFSATMPESIIYLAEEHMKKHEVVAVSKDEVTVKDTEQVYCEVNYYNKVATMKKVIEDEKIESAIIFCNTKDGVDKLASVMHKMHYPVEAIHGNISQARRTRVMSDFRSGRFKFLIATDVAARGLDIKGVSHVINYNVPQDPKNYVHRIGRTGRAGNPGKAITFVSEREREFLGGIEWFIDMKIRRVDYNVPEEQVEPGQRGKQRPQTRHRQYHHDVRRGPGKYAFV